MSNAAIMQRMSDLPASSSWLNAITTDSHREVAKRVGVAASTITRAVRADNPPPNVVAAVARSYGFDVLRALVLAGFLEPEEVEGYGLDSAVDRAPSALLLHKLLERETRKQ